MNYLALLFPDFSLILCGYFLCRYTALDRSVWEPVERLVYFFLFPILLFHAIVRSPLELQVASHLIMAGLLLGVWNIGISYALPYLPWVGHYFPARLHAGSAQVGFRFNSFIALALAERVAGPQGLLLIAVLIGVCVPMFNVAAIWPMAKHGQKGFFNELVRNPLIIATLSGLMANVLGFQLPEWAIPSVQRIGGASLALGLMSAGAGMQFGKLAHAKTLSVSLLVIRHFLAPVVAFGLAQWLALDRVQTTVLMAFSALPTASTCYVLAARMGYDGAYVAGLVTMSTLLGLISLPFAFSFIN